MKGNENLVNKFLNDITHITVEDCDKLLVTHGYSLHKSGGSHRVYHKKGDTPIIVVTPKSTKYVKSGYVKMLNKKLNLEG
jgi:predicted RNA binding protein YcfA (HicA-like mRNA interferase family)